MFPQPVIALWTRHPGDLLGTAITFITHGTAEHAGWLGSDGATIYEAYLPIVRQRPVLEPEKPLVRLFTLEGMTPDIAARFDRFLTLATDPKFAGEYSIKGLFGFALNIPPADEQHVFCSEWVMQGIRKVHPDLLPLARCEDYEVSPVDLLRSPRLHEISWPDVLKPFVFIPSNSPAPVITDAPPL